MHLSSKDAAQETGSALRLSVVIGTSNRPALVALCLQSLLPQITSHYDREVLLIDNSTNEETHEMFHAQFGRTPQFRYVRLPIVSGNIARNEGTQLAKGEYVAFLDDDAEVSPQWIEEMLAAFAHFGPKAGCIGGPSALRYDVPKPRWLSDWLLPFLGALDWGDAPLTVSEAELFFGLNVAFRRDALLAVGVYGKGPDRGTANLLSNSEYPMQIVIQRAGYTRHYVPGMRVRHFAPAARLKPWWFVRRAFWQGVSDVRLFAVSGIKRPPPARRLSSAHRRSLWRCLIPTPANAHLLLCWMALRVGYASARMALV